MVQGLCSETRIKNPGQVKEIRGSENWLLSTSFLRGWGGVLCLSSNSSCQLPRTSKEPKTKCKRRKESCHQEVPGATFREGNLGLASSSCERFEWSHRKGNRKAQKRVLLLREWQKLLVNIFLELGNVQQELNIVIEHLPHLWTSEMLREHFYFSLLTREALEMCTISMNYQPQWVGSSMCTSHDFLRA